MVKIIMTLDEIIELAQPLINEMSRRRNIRYDVDCYIGGLKKGRTYVKILSGEKSDLDSPFGLCRCEGFIDQEGNILFAAGYYKPAKGPNAIRGNLLVNNGFDALDEKGNIRYLRG